MKRYKLRFHATPTGILGAADVDPDGPWVGWDDVQAELTALRKVAEAAEKFCRAEGRDDPPSKYAALKEALEAAGYKPTRMN